MYRNYIYITICALINTAIFIYATDNPVDNRSSLYVKMYMYLMVVAIPAGLAYLTASSKKDRSSVIIYCSLLTVASGVFFTNMHSSSHDQSKDFILAIHFALTYLFSFIILASYGRPAKKLARTKVYVTNSEANRQISMILGMHSKGMPGAGIASILNQNRELFLLDNSEWSEGKVLGVISTFSSGVQKPN